MPAAAPDLLGACCFPAAPGQSEFGSRTPLFVAGQRPRNLSSYLFLHPNLPAVYFWGNICLHILLKFCKACECQRGWGQVSGLMCPGLLVIVSG